MTGESPGYKEERKLDSQSDNKYYGLYRSASHKIKEVVLLDRLRASIARELDVDTIVQNVTRGIAGLFGYPLVSIYLLQDDTLVLQTRVGDEKIAERIPVSQGIEGLVVSNGKSILTKKEKKVARSSGDLGLTASKICVPLVDQDNVIGVLCVQRNKGRDLSEDDLHLIKAIGENTSNALWRARIYSDSLRTREALDKERRLLRTVIDNLPDQIFARDRDCRFTLSNLSDAKMMGVSDPEQLIGKNDLDFFPQDLAKRYIADDKLVMDSGKPLINIQEPISDPDGHDHWIMTTKVPLRDSQNQVIGLVGIARDITKQKQDAEALEEARRQAEEANKAKSKFLANMSHEIRTPLNAILGFSQLLLREPNLSPQQRHQLTTINHSGEHLLELINDILEISKIEADRTTIHIHPFDLFGLIRDLQSMFQVRMDEKHITFEVVFYNGVPHQIISDESKIRQILINLIGNAIKFTKQGQIRCIVDGRHIEENMWNLRIKIEDTGAGIAEEDIPALFQIFQQAPSVQVDGGTGLGLAISQRFAKMLNGEITVTSKLGAGSCFTLDIPVQEGQNTQAERKVIHQTITGIVNASNIYRVLVVDDNKESRELLSSLLIPVGFDVMEASNGKEALDVYRSWNTHLIIMDIRMPVMDGLEATRHIRNAETDTHVPIIAATASAFEEEKQKVIDAGMDGYIRKPIQEQELFSVIGDSLGIEYSFSTDVASPRSYPTPTQADIFSSIPPDVREQLLIACSNADLDRIIEMVDEITPDFPSAARQLEELASQLQYEEILKLLRERE